MNRFDIYLGGILIKIPNNQITLEELRDIIQSNKYKHQILKIRNERNEEKQKILKNQLDYVTIGGTFSERKKENLINSSEYLVIDIDDDHTKEIRIKLEKSQYTRMLFESPRGGFKVIVQILKVENDIQYKEFINAIWDEYDKITKVDRSGADISRACFLSYDLNIYYNQDSKIWINRKKPSISFDGTSFEINEELIQLITSEWIETKRQKIALALTGVLRIKGYGMDIVENLIREVMKRTNDNNINERLSVIKSTFNKNEDELQTYFGIKQNFSIENYKKFCSIINHEIKLNKNDYEIKNITSHFPNFIILEQALGLYGNEYKTVKKALWYHMLGNAIKEPEKYINFNGIMFDTRVNLSLFMNSGSGKNDINRVCLNTLPGLQVATTIVSIHPEQLVGKSVVNKKDGTVKHNKGYLDDDELIIDEARYFFTKAQGTKEGMYDELRKYFCIALNPMGINKITKRSVEQSRSQMLEYYPRSSVILLSQPVSITKEVIESGFLRRFIPLNVNGNTNKREIFKLRIAGEDKSPYTIKFREFLNEVIEKIDKKTWNFYNIDDTLEKYASLLVSFGTLHSEKAAQYMNNIYAQSTLDLLLKFSAIVAVFTRGEKTIISEDVKIAYMDLFEIMNSMFNCIDKYSDDFYTYDMSYNDLLLLRWMKQHKAISSKQSKMNVDGLTEYISILYGCSKGSAIKNYQSLVRKKFIQVNHGKTEATVFLTEKAINELKQENITDGDDFYEEYLKICKEVKNGKNN